MSETHTAQAVAVEHGFCERHRLLGVLPTVVLASTVPGTTTGALRQDSLATRTWAQLIPIDNVTVPSFGSKEGVLVFKMRAPPNPPT
jgi:hypothetical protein